MYSKRTLLIACHSALYSSVPAGDDEALRPSSNLRSLFQFGSEGLDLPRD